MENIVSKFLVSTCCISTEFNVSSHFLFLPLEKFRYYGPAYTHTVCGSQAEFYIQPINPCIDDLDIQCTSDTLLAFDSSRCEITEGSDDLCDMILCSKLEAYGQNKSFVRLRDTISGAYDWNLEEYNMLKIPMFSCMPRDFNLSPTTIIGMLMNATLLSNIKGKVVELNEEDLKMWAAKGPALKSMFPNVINAVDFVPCMRCPRWPLVAEEWPKRRRYNSGWPNSATIAKVFNEGCDVVAVAHRDVHEDLTQWRISFSRAEVTLIQSWTPIQQIVYHLLRFFVKKEIIRKNCPKNEEVVCTYHLKTLMLWSCEEESAEWWETSSVLEICCKLLGRLCECLKHKHCPNYFIPEANLFDHELNSEILQQTIKKLDDFNDVDKMTQWFVTHYILPVYQELFYEDETQLTKEKVEICRISVCDNIETGQLDDLDSVILMCALRCFLALEYLCSLRDKYTIKMADSEIPFKWFIDTTVFSKMRNTLADYMKAFILFHMSQCLLSSKFQFDVELLSEIWTHIIRQRHFVESPNFMQPLCTFDESMIYFNRAEQIMKHLVFGYSENESCLAKMVSVLCLHKSLCCHDESSCKTETVSRIYLAALYYYIGHLQCTLHLCSKVATSFKENNHSRKVRNLKVNSLLFMDDLATIAGFLLLRRHILRITKKRIFLLCPELFVHYLFCQCKPETVDIKETFSMALSFDADCCLAALMRYKILRRFDRKIPRKLIYSRYTEDAEESATDIALPGKTDIAEALVRISNDYMTHFYAALSREYGSKFNLASSYEALALYLCRRYEDVIGLCDKLLEEPEHDSDLEEFQFLNVNISFFFISYFDEDIQTLVGFQLLVLHLSSIIQQVVFEDIHDDNSENEGHLQAISAYTTHYETFNPILRRQFLGNYLKLRCLIDLGFPLFEVKSALRCLKRRFLFEHTLVHFMHQKIIRCYRVTTTTS